LTVERSVAPKSIYAEGFSGASVLGHELTIGVESNGLDWLPVADLSGPARRVTAPSLVFERVPSAQDLKALASVTRRIPVTAQTYPNFMQRDGQRGEVTR